MSHRAAPSLHSSAVATCITLRPLPLAWCVHLALAGCAILTLGSSATAHAQETAAPAHRYDIPAGPLGLAIARFASTSGVLLAGASDLVQGRSSLGVSGNYSAGEAMRRLLAGTGLEAVLQNNGTYSLRELPAGADAAEALPVVRVNGQAEPESADGPVIGYVAKRSASATKSDTALMETARSISVVTREQMDIQGVQTIEQSLRYSAGISTETNGFDTRHEAMVARGFDTGPVYVDGLRTFKTGSYGDWIAEQNGLERVEFVRGPVSVLYGQASPGGLINLVSKRPSPDAANEVTASLGNHSRKEVTFDLNAPLSEDGKLLFRLNGLGRESGTQVDFGKDNRVHVAPTLSWTPSADTKITLLADLIQDRMMPKSWWPIGYLTTDPALRGPLPRQAMYTGEPGFDHYNRDASNITYLLEHRIDDTWSFSQGGRWSRFQLDYSQVYGRDITLGSSGLPQALTRRILSTRTDSRTVTLDNHLQAKFATGALAHKLLLGVDYQHFSGDEDQYFSGDGEVADLDLYNPVYGAPVTLGPYTGVSKRLRQLGLYAQEQVQWGPWIANLGLRRDSANTNSVTAGTPGTISRTADNSTTYNAGLLYKTSFGLSPYASYATSFMPNVDSSNDGTAFKPETGRQFEIGLKYQPPGSNSMYTAALFDLRKHNVTTPTPDQTDLMQTGAVRSRGLELEAVAGLTKRLNLIASYTYLDSEITSSNDPTEMGRPFQGTARHTAKLWLDYHWQEWTSGVGLRHVSKMAAGADPLTGNPYSDPAFTLIDAALRANYGPVTVSLNVSNLFDKITVVANQFYSQGRAMKATVAYRW